MGDQELLQEPEIMLQNPLESPPEEFDIDSPDFSVHHRQSPSLSAATTHRHHSPCSSCGCSGHSRKRPSTTGPTSHHPNPAKKLFLDTPPPAVHHHHHSAAASSLPLRRTVSDSLAASGSGVSSNASPAPENLSATPRSASNSSRPPLPPTLRRCLSNPISSPSPPPRPSSSSAEDFNNNTPSSKLSKMLSSWREFNKYMEEEFVQVERQTEDLHSEEIPSLILVPNTENNNKNGNENENGFVNTNKDDSVTEFEESLSVERVGERLNIHFKCQCGNAYQFLIVDGNCFYKLM